MSKISDILSQSEINELLNSLTNPVASLEQKPVLVSTKKVREYDFKTPKKLSKEQIKIVSGIYENFSRQLSSYFSGILRTYSQINIISIEEQHYYEYNNALPDTVLIGVIDLSTIEGAILVDISNSITYNLIERLLGGGARESSIIPDREFSEIEISLMQRIMNQIAVYTKDAWSGLAKAEASLKSIETNARLIQAIAMDEIVLIVIMEVNIGNIKGTINFCIPCMNIDPLINKISQNRYASKRVQDSAQEDIVKESLVHNVKQSPLEVSAVLGETVLTLQEIINLQVGDVIKLDNDVTSDIKININSNVAWFYGTPGVRKKKKVVKVNKVIHK